MGRRLDSFFRRSFRASRFKALLGLAVSRVAVLKNQRQARCSQARDDVAQLLQLGQQQRALLRVEHLIKAQNMLDVLVMIEDYCLLLTERIILIKNEKVCPHELKEAVSSLIFAASRCGDFPELQEIRCVFSARYGREFAAAAVELRNSCGVNPKMIQKMSTKQPTWEGRVMILRDIGAEIGIAVNMEDPLTRVSEEESDSVRHRWRSTTTEPQAVLTNRNSPAHMRRDNSLNEPDQQQQSLSGSVKSSTYKDVASAAQAAYESAAYAAAAARAAFELSKPGWDDGGSDGDNSTSPRRENADASEERDDSSQNLSSAAENSYDKLEFEKIHPLGYHNFTSEESCPQRYNSSVERSDADWQTPNSGSCGGPVKPFFKEPGATEQLGLFDGSNENFNERYTPINKNDRELARTHGLFHKTNADAEQKSCGQVSGTPVKQIRHPVSGCELSSDDDSGSDLPPPRRNRQMPYAYVINSVDDEFSRVKLTAGSDEDRVAACMEQPCSDGVDQRAVMHAQGKPVSVRTRRGH